MNLSGESEKAPNSIQIVKGPWQHALAALDGLADQENVLVYIDAPYKRDEYSRYYHVLETLVSYSYPSCIGSGKMPDKREGGRFQSEFFTRNEAKLASAFTTLICSVLRKGWMCAWSYSDSGAAKLVKVVEQIAKDVDVQVKSYAVQYVHMSQGKRPHKKVTEYLIIFAPDQP